MHLICYNVAPLVGRGFAVFCVFGCLASPFAFDVVGDLMDLVEGVAVAVYEVGYFACGVHDGGVIATAEGATDLG